MKMNGGGGTPHTLLTLALHRGEWSTSCPSHFTLRENAPTEVVRYSLKTCLCLDSLLHYEWRWELQMKKMQLIFFCLSHLSMI